MEQLQSSPYSKFENKELIQYTTNIYQKTKENFNKISVIVFYY